MGRLYILDRFLHIIVNQQSRNSAHNFKALLLELPKYTNKYKIHQTKNIEQLKILFQLLKGTLKEEDMIVFVGGDGSLNQGLTLLEELEISNIIGYIPSGSGNDFARTHGIPNEIQDSLAYLFQVKEPRELSVIHAHEGLTHYYAVNSMGFGIDGLVNYVIAQKKSDKGSGSMTYLTSALSAFKRLESFPITLKVDDGVFQFNRAQIGLVVNNPYFGGGLKIIPEASSEDDVLEVLIAEDANFKDLVSILSRMVINKSHFKNKKLSLFKTKSIALYIDASQYGQKDGEVIHQDGYALTIQTKKKLFWL